MARRSRRDKSVILESGMEAEHFDAPADRISPGCKSGVAFPAYRVKQVVACMIRYLTDHAEGRLNSW
jgi:hypothetical protein